MAFRIHEIVIRGEIDNTVRGRVTGCIWLMGYKEPLLLDLAGDCWPDMAGRRLCFTNRDTPAGQWPGLAIRQTGEVGDITASRKVRVPDLPLSQWLECKRCGEPAPEHMDNALYLEWYSDCNGRVVIESASYKLELSLPQWEMTPEQARRQSDLSAEAMRRFLNRLESSLRPQSFAELSTAGDMDEHEWERFLQAADARTTRYGELLDKFQDHPQAERLVGKYMGWQAPEPEPECDDAPGSDWQQDDAQDWQPPEPDPATEGIDWVRTETGNLCHPLQLRCQKLALQMFFTAKDLLDEQELEGDTDISEMLFQAQATSAKLAGALNSVAEGVPMQPGFTVAILKRALALLNKALAAADAALADGKMPQAIPEYRREMLQIRSDIIDLTQQYRHH